MKLALFKLKISNPIAASTFIIGDLTNYGTHSGTQGVTLKHPIFGYEMITPEQGFIQQAGKRVAHTKINIGYSYAPCEFMTQGEIKLDVTAWDWWREINGTDVLDEGIRKSYLKTIEPYTEGKLNEPSNGGFRGSSVGAESPVV